MPESITGIQASSALTELFALTGKLPLTLDGTVVPVVSLGDVAREVTYGPLCYGQCELTAGGAANAGKVEISLPVINQTQGLSVLVEQVRVRLGGVGYISIRPSPGLAAATANGLKAWADTRKRGLPNALISGKNDAAPTGVAGIIWEQLPATTLFSYDLDWILGLHPDTGVQQGLFIETTALNTNFMVGVRWREGTAR